MEILQKHGMIVSGKHDNVFNKWGYNSHVYYSSEEGKNVRII